MITTKAITFAIIYLALYCNVTDCTNTTASNEQEDNHTGDTDTYTVTTENVKENTVNDSNRMPKSNYLKEVYETLLIVQEMYIIPVVCPIGILGNGLVAHHLFIRRNSNSSFIYIFFILMADILSLLSDIFLPVSRLLQSNTSESMKHFAANLYYWNADVISFLFRRFSLNIFCVLSFERLTAIKRPLHLSRSVTVTHSYLFLILAFVVGFMATIVTPLFTKMAPLYDPISNTTNYVRSLTSLYKNNDEYFAIVMIVCRFFDGPLQVGFFSVINIMIIYCLYQNKKTLALSINKDRSKSISKVQARLCKIFLMLCFTNMLAFFPNAVIIIIGKLFPKTGLNIRSYTMQLIVFGGNFLRVLNSLTDFAVFLVMSKDIRGEIKNKLMCKQPMENSNKSLVKETQSISY